MEDYGPEYAPQGDPEFMPVAPRPTYAHALHLLAIKLRAEVIDPKRAADELDALAEEVKP